MDHTEIAGRQIPIRHGPHTVVQFTGDCDPKDPAGGYDFWVLHDAEGGIVGRRLSGTDPGERFRSMEGDANYKGDWDLARRAVGIYAADGEAVIAWLNTHPLEAKCAANMHHCQSSVCRLARTRRQVFVIATGGHLIGVTLTTTHDGMGRLFQS